MMPNITDKNKILFTCECGGEHTLEITYEDFNGEVSFGSGMWVNVFDKPVSLWYTVRNWWRDRKYWQSEMLLTPDDVKAMHKKLGQYLEEYEEHKKKGSLV